MQAFRDVEDFLVVDVAQPMLEAAMQHYPLCSTLGNIPGVSAQCMYCHHKLMNSLSIYDIRREGSHLSTGRIGSYKSYHYLNRNVARAHLKMVHVVAPMSAELPSMLRCMGRSR